MPPSFRFKTAQESMLMSLSWESAQEWCNFVLFKPTWFPTDLKEVKNTVRPESSEEPAAHRLELRGEVRALSIKQFLYDWAPPAYDHPCLWRNAKISRRENTPIPHAEWIGNNCLWFGLDYRRKQAATINLLRTQIEITVLQGHFEESELTEMVYSMQPVSRAASKAILEHSFAELAYQKRHHESASDVPTGYFAHTRNKKFSCYPLDPSEVGAKSLFPGKWLLSANIPGYRLDSLFLFGKDAKQIHESEYYFESDLEPGIYVRCLVTAQDSSYAIGYPPRLGDQECQEANYPLKEGGALYHAHSKKESRGSHCLVFLAGSEVVSCMVKPAPWTTTDWAMDLVRNLIMYALPN